MHRFSSVCATCLTLVCLLTAGHASAHRVNIFAYRDGADIVTECGFSRSARVKQGLVEVFDAVTGVKIVEGRTDGDGIFRFPVPGTDIRNGHGLRIRINAGEGHQNDWLMDPTELDGAGSTTASPPAPSVPAADAQAADAAAPAPMRGDWATPQDVERIVDEALNARLAPMHRLLARQSEAGPSLADIIGGIGWIFGLAGMAAWFRRRR